MHHEDAGMPPDRGHSAVSRAKTLAEHHATLVAMVRLHLFWLHGWLAAHPQETLAEALVQRVDIWRKTDLNRGGLVEPVRAGTPEWQALVAGIEACQRRHPRAHQSSAFEEDAFAVVRARVAARAADDFAREQRRDHLREYTCGSLRYHLEETAAGRGAFLHVANAIAPQSIFAERAYLRHCLLALMDLAEREHGLTTLRTHTWLNSHPTWLTYFPPTWHDHLGPVDSDVQWHYGFWGQFLTARGTYNARLGEILRRTGAFPYPPRTAWCSFADLRLHLHQDRS